MKKGLNIKYVGSNISGCGGKIAKDTVKQGFL